MRNLLNPRWLFVVNTLPLALLFFILFGDHSIIKSQLPPESIALWLDFAIVLTALASISVLYAAFLIYQDKKISVIYGIFALLSHMAFFFVCATYAEQLIPREIPLWMLSGDPLMYVVTFLMPTLAYALFIMVARVTPDVERRSAGVNFGSAVAIPVVFYLFFQIIAPLWQPVSNQFIEHAVIVSIVAGTVAFLFLLIRSVYILVSQKKGSWQKDQLFWKVLISVIFPIWGLLINNGGLFGWTSIKGSDSGVFGDFNSYWFYGLALLNGLFICLPNPANKNYRLFLFLGRSLTFAYTFYFFLVFLPYLPLSILAVIAIGVGFLMLTPLVLFVVHTGELTNDFAFLKAYYSKRMLVVSAVLAFLVMPVVITISYLHDESVLYESLDYLYTPDYGKPYEIDAQSLERTVDVVRSHKARNNQSFSSNQTPYLSAYFNWLVLANLTLSEAKLNTIESVFFGKSSVQQEPVNPTSDVEIDTIGLRSRYDSTQNAWLSWVDFRLTNRRQDGIMQEYATVIDLPAGCWISDYYLYVGKKKEMGILAEKKAALWVYSRIREVRRDPGILYYLTGNRVAFRVYPFFAKEARRTGIEFLHKETVVLTIDGREVTLGKPSPEVPDLGQTGEPVVYVSAREKQSLARMKRRAYLHFLVDASERARGKRAAFTKRIEAFLRKYPDGKASAKLSFVNTYIETMPLQSDWKKRYETQLFTGGFYLDRALKKTLVDAYQTQNDTYPVPIVVTDDFEQAVLNKDLADYAFAVPESDLFFELNEKNALVSHALTSSEPEFVSADSLSSFMNKTVLAFPVAPDSVRYLRDDDQAEILLKNQNFTPNESEMKAKNWQSALMMDGQWRSQLLHPETAQTGWLALIKSSFRTKILTPVTSYLVVENEAQRAVLRKKQAQTLASNKSLDLGEEQRMSEPELWLLLVLLGVFVWYRMR